MSLLAFEGALRDLSPEQRRLLLERTPEGTRDEVRRTVSRILADVAERGDAALLELALRFDGVRLESVEVPRRALDDALACLDPGLRRALERAARNIATAHEAQRPVPTELETEPGIRVGRRPEPLARVGVYAPGGRAAYPSSVLMGAVPARVAGVREVIVCSPPDRATGLPSTLVLAAAAIAGADRVFALGGAGAVGALAYGTATVPRVDRIVGPGNAWVAEAKAQVQSVVGTDAPAGPSELLVVADDTADTAAVAREMLAQAEHDPDAAVVTLAFTRAIAEQIREALDRLVPFAPRAEIIRQAFGARGALLTCDDPEALWTFANAFAAEHLLIATADPRSDLGRVRAAGTVFLGVRSSVAFGDYTTGANHVLPTAGIARSLSGLSLLDFYRWTTWQEVSPDAARRLAADTELLATAEGLPAHAAAAGAWKEGQR